MLKDKEGKEASKPNASLDQEKMRKSHFKEVRIYMVTTFRIL